MVKTGLDIIANSLPSGLKGKRIGILCHAPSITSDFTHITDLLHSHSECRLGAIFGPQHGLSGQTQDNMIEWEGNIHPRFGVPVYSLYGKVRKPTPEMLEGIDAFIADIQDAGARLYTYIWTVKLCMEACRKAGIPFWLLDRPNPIGRIPFDGPVLKSDHYTFVGGASIPMCHRMSAGEMALWVNQKSNINCDLKIVWMEGWKRSYLYSDCGIPWVLPSPNLPSLQSAIVYPGMVLAEALNLSEGRGTTIPFELTGAPFIEPYSLIKNLERRNISSCHFRAHSYIPTFHKFSGQLCQGIQIHVTDPSNYHPVEVAAEIFEAIIQTTPGGSLKFLDPPYEYEEHLIPFDILSGDPGLRITLLNGGDLKVEKERWRSEIDSFTDEFRSIRHYEDK